MYAIRSYYAARSRSRSRSHQHAVPRDRQNVRTLTLKKYLEELQLSLCERRDGTREIEAPGLDEAVVEHLADPVHVALEPVEPVREGARIVAAEVV